MKCKICGRLATGVHYGVLACEGCKAFYRRALARGVTYLCNFDKKCTNFSTQPCCKACRFQKCSTLGMKIYGSGILKKINAKPEVALEDNENAPIVYLHLPFNDSWPSQRAQQTELQLPSLLYSTNQHMYVLDQKRRQMTLTVQSVQLAVDTVFGEQIFRWTKNMNQCLNNSEVKSQSPADLETVITALRFNCVENLAKLQKFTLMLPGVAHLNTSVEREVTAGWKWLAFWLLQRSPFAKNGETYMTIGDQQFHYSRYWEELIVEPSYLDITYKFYEQINDIGLNQIETYLLLAVIIFEPEADITKNSWESNRTIIHRHYIDVLFDMIKRRCSNHSELMLICGKLEQFFSALKLVSRLHQDYFEGQDRTYTPFRTSKGQDALCLLWKDTLSSR